jgi:hypothetical protein
LKLNLDLSEQKRNELEVVFIEREAVDKLIVKTKRRLQHLNVIVKDSREYFLSLIRDNGAGYFAMEHSKSNGLFDDLASALRLGSALGLFDYTEVELKPKNLICALRIAELFELFTNVISAEFEYEFANEKKTRTVTGLSNILDAIDEVERNKEVNV